MIVRAEGGVLVVIQAIGIGIGGIVVALLESEGLLSTRLSYMALTLMLLFFLWLQVTTIRRRHPQRWLLNPAIVSALMLFTFGYGISNVLFFLPPESIHFLGLVPEVVPAMVTHQHLVLLGAIMLYLGYWSPMASKFVRPQAVARFQRRYLPAAEAIHPLAIPVLIGVSLVARVFALSQGLYGYGGDYSADRLAQTASYSQYLSLLGGLGKLALLLAALRYVAPGQARNGTRWFWLALFIEVFFGFLSGMKSAVGMPLVIAGVAHYLRSGVVPWRWVAMTFVAIVAAYAVIEPFRDLRHQHGPLTSVSQTTSLLQLAIEADQSARPDNDTGSTLIKILGRQNLSYIGAYGIEYADAHSSLPIGSPAFLQDLLLAPIHAVVPRFIWESKPLGNLGLWYTQVVLNRNIVSSTAMGPFTYLYFAGGYGAVAIAFFVIGTLQRVIWFRLAPWRSIPGAIIMLVLMGTIAVIPSAVNGVIINLIREGILMLMLVHILFRSSRAVKARNSPRSRSIS